MGLLNVIRKLRLRQGLPKANVERYDALRGQIAAGGRHAS